MADNREPLLVKRVVYYHENCPGCKVDKEKAESPNIAWLKFFYIWVITLSSALSISSIFPFLYYMVRDFHIANREEDVSFYAGFVGCSLLVGRFLTAVHWGMAADRFGRKPVMIISTMAVVIFNVTFGLSKSFWTSIISRFLIGALNGAFGPMRAYATEVSRREHQALAVSMMSSAWGIGLIIGPALGGYLSQPAEKFPNVFSQESIFGRFPYFLVSLVISVFSLFVFGICFCIPETLHSHAVEDDAQIVSIDVEKSQNTEAGTSSTWLTLLRNWPLMSLIILYSVFQTHDIAYIEVFSLWSISPRALGGLNLGTNDVGQALAVGGFSLMLCQVSLYPILERSLGPLVVCRVATVISIVVATAHPFFTNLTGTNLKLVVDLAIAALSVLSCSITTGLLLLQNRTVNQQQRGAANGLSLCIVSLSNAFGPLAAGIIVSWAQSRQNASFLPGSHMVFFILNVLKVIGLLMTFKPFLAKPAHEFN